jgi:hypothetical protein
MISRDPLKKYLGLICFILALCGAIFTGGVDFNNDEPQASALLILVVTFLVGLILPKKAWLWAIIVALGIPGVYLCARAMGYQPVSPPSPGWYASLLALIPAFIGVYAGALGRMVINKATLNS